MIPQPDRGHQQGHRSHHLIGSAENLPKNGQGIGLGKRKHDGHAERGIEPNRLQNRGWIFEEKIPNFLEQVAV